MTYEELEIKIKSMTAKEIIIAMVDGLKNPVMKVNMETFGVKVDEVCFGCAATNMICKLGELNPSEEIGSIKGYTKYSSSNMFIGAFEMAINDLRSGSVIWYNKYAIERGFAQIKITRELPQIKTRNYKDPVILQEYIDLANEQ